MNRIIQHFSLSQSLCLSLTLPFSEVIYPFSLSLQTSQEELLHKNLINIVSLLENSAILHKLPGCLEQGLQKDVRPPQQNKLLSALTSAWLT